ncbi:MAG: transglutaminase family protein [Stellaceae bacterium]|jgi:transglutaminase-like putative cysteine protease
MKIRVGYEIRYQSAAATPMLLMLSLHPSRLPDLLTPHRIDFDPPIPANDYRDSFGNICTRIVAPEGPMTISADMIVADSGEPDVVEPHALQHPIEDLPEETLVFLLGSRYCETDRLSEIAWSRFGAVPPGWGRVQAIVDFVHEHITFGYEHARPTKTAWDVYVERAGVCRDFTHLAVTLCRCMNIPARYCTGYLGDIGVPPVPAPMDFSAWFEVYLGSRWHTFDARHNRPRIGRIIMARGRDATDVAISTAFGSSSLTGFTVITDELLEDPQALRHSL